VNTSIVTLAAAPSRSAAAEIALAHHFAAASPPRPPIVVADAGRPVPGDLGFGQVVTDVMSRSGQDVRRVAPANPLSSLLRVPGRFQRRHRPVEISARTARIPRVWFPRAIAEAGTLIGVNDVGHETAARPTLAIGLWSRFAGWRERAGVRLTKPEAALAAEIALAVRPALILLADDWRGWTIVVATADQIAAELVALGLRQTREASGDDRLGPWQDPLVQRATELDLGVRIPDQIQVRGTIAVEADQSRTSAFVELVARVTERLGVRAYEVGGEGAEPRNR
jgi:hypothetical protein